MAKAPSRLTLIGGAFVLVALAVVGRAAQLQLGQGEQWRARAAAQQTVRVSLPARRGTLYDRTGVPLAVSQETYAVGVSPRDLDDVAPAVPILAQALGLPAQRVAAQLAARRVWMEWPGPFTWTRVAPLKRMRGVTLMRRLERFYPRPELASGLIGRLDVRGRGASGLERAFDSLLAGRGGTAVMIRDPVGRLYPSPSRPVAEAVDGADVVLTLDAELQDIADRALRQGVADAGASGGDVVIVQPETGEILALASARAGSTGAVGGTLVGDAFEPGSTAKPFAAAALLRAGRATPIDTVFAENGMWTDERGRRIHDTHPSAVLTLADVIRVSSNIGIAKLARRLTHVEEYEALRDFGFGTPTGIELPGESGGTLRAVRRWTDESAASLAMGYELAVTPLQLAAAYGVFANGGVLLEPALVREVRDAEGAVRSRHRTRPVRRVLSERAAAQVTNMLMGVVEEGTGRRAALGTYPVAGKTGTSRRVVAGRYREGRYWASFVGLFPAVNPQLVLVVKIDDPSGDYFGGAAAAPVTRAILEAALATPAVTLDRTRLARRRLDGAPEGGVVAAAPVRTAVVPWPLGEAVADSQPRAVPSVTGLDVRAAVRALHQGGFRVRLVGAPRGAVTAMSPEAGAAAPRGSLITIRTGAADAR